MISKKQLVEISKQSGLDLYQQEKEYALKLFLFNYYKRFEEAVFKGGTCIKYLFGLDRFSEDLDFNIRNPQEFQKQVRLVLKQMALVGMQFSFRKEEIFNEAYAAEISFQGPLFNGNNFSLNKFRIDAGYRFGTLAKPEWTLVASEYPETTKNFLVKSMNEEEMLAEKVLALFERKKGRDLFDAWFLLKKGVRFDKKLFEKKAKRTGKKTKIDFEKIATKKEFERDLSKLTKKTIPYDQIRKELEEKLPQ